MPERTRLYEADPFQDIACHPGWYWSMNITGMRHFKLDNEYCSNCTVNLDSAENHWTKPSMLFPLEEKSEINSLKNVGFPELN